MSEVEKFDLFRESCELDDRIHGYESELTQIEGHIRWLKRQIEILNEKRKHINSVLVEEARKGNGQNRVDKANSSKLDQ